MHQKLTLDNGLRLVMESMDSVRSVTVGIWIKSGSRFEASGKHGISHLLEHMLFKGTNKRSAQDIAEEVDSIGGHINAFTAKEYTCFYIKMIDEHFETAVDILSDMYFNSMIGQEALEKEKQVVLEELKMYEDTPDELVHDIVVESSYKGHPLAHNVLGDRESVQNLSREDLLTHYQGFFTPANTVIAVSGNIDVDRVKQKINDTFNINCGADSKVKDPHPPRFSIDTINKYKDTEQIHYCLAFPGYAIEDAKVYQLSLLNNVVGGGMSSKLFQEIREKQGLAYAVYSYYLNFMDSGLFIIYAGTSPNNLNATIDILWNSLDHLKTNALSSDELSRAKEQVKGNILMGLESTSNRMAKIGRDELLLNRIRSYQDIIDEIEQVTKADLMQLAREVFNKNSATTAMIGPKQ